MSLFDKASVKRWRRVCHRELDRLGAGDNGDFRRAGLVAMSVYAFGTDIETLSTLSGQTPAFVRNVLKRLRAQRVLKGQTLRVNWNEDDKWMGFVSLACDLLVAEGTVDRPIDAKRSAALKGKAGRKKGSQSRPRTVVPSGAVFSPKVQAVPNQYYQIAAAAKQDA